MKTPLASVPPQQCSPTHFTDAHAREVFAAFEQSGLPAAVFARQQGIGVHRLYAWKRRLKKNGAAPAFIPVRVAASSKTQAKPEGVVELHRAGFVIRITGRVDTQQLRSILEAMDALPC
jgi:hypothetical protein